MFKKGEVLLLFTAIIWGTAFIFQSISAELIGPFLFNGSRFFLGGLVILPFLFKKDPNNDFKKEIQSGIILGIIMFIAPNLQQFAMANTSAGKAGFMTSLYIILVPILSFIFLKKRISKRIFISLVLAMIGLYLLCGASLDFRFSDISLILCAFFFALQIIVVEHYVKWVNPLKMSCLQYLIAGGLSLICAFIFEDFNLTNYASALPSILYTGIFSTAVAYTLQIIGQKTVDATVASIIMSLESTIAALSGYIFLHQSLSLYELEGCILMFCAVILSQLPSRIKE